MRVVWSAGAALAAAGATLLGSPPSPQQFTTGATAVVVDVVVRDKAGRFVAGLTPADFTVAEDGVAQRITSLQLVGAPAPATSDRPAAPPTSAGAPTAATAPDQPRFTALVFDRLEAKNAAISRAGGEAAIANAGGTDVIGVFLIDHGLRMMQPFTTDKSRLAAAVGRTVERATAMVVRDPSSGRRSDGGDTPGSAASAEFAGNFDDNGIPQVPESVWEVLDRQFQGRETTDALLTAAAALSTLPGRKTLLYFSDAIAIPDLVLPKFHDVVATANRGQVTIYAIDTAGLRVGSQDAETAAQIRGIGKAGLEINADGSSSSNLAMLERNEDVLRRSPRVGLTMLAKPTGGFLIDNTNDLAAGVRRIDDDRRVHYLLTYQPAKPELDGRWRSIDVKVSRRGTTVQARQGYVAVRSPGVLPVLVYEGPALAALDRTPPPRDVAARVGAFVFPRAVGEPDGRGTADDLAVVVTAPADRVTFEVKGSTYRTDFTMLALVRDGAGEPVHKTSQPYRLTGPAKERDRATAGVLRFARALPVPAGTYTTWGAVHDMPSGRAGVASAPVRVEPRGPSGLGVSSLVLLGRVERVAPDAVAPGDPWLAGDLLITPNLGEPMRRSPEAKLGFYFTVVGATPGERLSARLQVVDPATDGATPLVDAPVTLEAADTRGRSRTLGQLPLAGLPSTALELRLSIGRNGHTDERRAPFVVHDPAGAPADR